MIRLLLLYGLGCVVLAPLPAQAAGAVQLPIRKAGLWEIKIMLRAGSPAPIMMQQCTDATTDRAMNGVASPTALQTCSKWDIRKTATGYAIDSVCTVMGRSVTTHSDVVGDLNSAYRVTIEGSPSLTEAKWLGACKPDQKPGDVMVPGSRKTNIMDLQKQKSQLPAR
jgi:hypothetical protein